MRSAVTPGNWSHWPVANRVAGCATVQTNLNIEWNFQTVAITPQLADRSDCEHARGLKLIRDNLHHSDRGDPLRHVVDKQKGH